MSTSNQKRNIATRGTRHLAFAVHPDRCFPKGKKSPRPYANWVESNQLKKGATQTVKINNHAVWTSIGELGPDSEPHHSGKDGGLISKTYCAEAKALSYSPDVSFEGNPAVRTDDLTTQNHANTVGRVLERAADMSLRLMLLALLLGNKPWKDEIQIVKRGNTYVIVDRKNKVIVLLGTQEFYGPGATADYARRATEQINRVWSGSTTFEGETYQVHSLITGSVQGDGEISGANLIRVDHTTQPAGVMSQTDPAWQMLGDSRRYIFWGPNGRQYTTMLDSGNTAAHEFGHSLGLPDEYTEGPRDANGNRQTQACTKHPNCLMGHYNGSVVPDYFDWLVNGDD